MHKKIPRQLSLPWDELQIYRTFAVPPMFEKRYMPSALMSRSNAAARIRLISKLPFSQERSSVEIHLYTLRIVLSAGDTTLFPEAKRLLTHLHCIAHCTYMNNEKSSKPLLFKERIISYLKTDSRIWPLSGIYARIRRKTADLFN